MAEWGHASIGLDLPKPKKSLQIKEFELVAGGGFDLYIEHRLRLPIVLASLTHCPR
jgi:hypothetical protein